MEIWKAHYFSYGDLVKLVETSPVDENAFMQKFNQELERIDLFINGKIVETVNNLKHLEKSLVEDSVLAEVISEDILKIDLYVHANIEACRKIIKKFVKKSRLSSVWYEQIKHERCLFKAQHCIHEFIVQLSDYHAKKFTSKSKEWEPPSSFSRTTIKYWVKPEDSTRLKLFVIKELPILELNKSKQINLHFHKQEYDQTHNFINSVYFDNDKLDCYHRRIGLEEGAQLLRLRWYGGQRRPGHTVPSPRGDLVFVERKTHHKKRTAEVSTKERFPFSLALLPAYLQGDITPEKVKLNDKFRFNSIQAFRLKHFNIWLNF